MGRSIEERSRQMHETMRRQHDPEVADNLDVRMAIMRRVKAGEITLAQGQAELASIKSAAKRNGKKTLYGN